MTSIFYDVTIALCRVFMVTRDANACNTRIFGSGALKGFCIKEVSVYCICIIMLVLFFNYNYLDSVV